MFSGVSNLVHDVDLAFLVVLSLCIGLFILVVVLMVVFILKYRKEKSPQATQIKDSIGLELIWTIIPLLLVSIMFYYGWAGYQKIVNVPKDAFVIKVMAQMWDWTFVYPNELQTKELFVPIDRAIKLQMESRDVLHSFSIPTFRVKQDVVPGMKTTVWFKAGKTGSFQIFCTEYCGLNHSKMLSKVRVMSEADFNKWYADAKKD